MKVGDLDIFYREAGPKDAPTILLLHGFPTSSQMFRKLIPALGRQVPRRRPGLPRLRPQLDADSHDKFTVHLRQPGEGDRRVHREVGLTKYALYVQDYGAPVGYRLAVKHPERITAIVVQNGNAYDEGSTTTSGSRSRRTGRSRTARRSGTPCGLVTYEATKWQYTHGVKNPELVSPDGAAHDQFLLDRKGNDEIQLDLFLSYGSNPPLYPKLAGVLPQAPAADADRLGQERPDLPARRCRAVQARPEDARVPPARRRPLRTRIERRRDRRC